MRTVTAIPLSICICSLHNRRATAFALIEALQRQPRSDEIEILLGADAGHQPTGAKRNRLVAAAVGAYIVHVDDDDAVADHYIPSILTAIEHQPDVDVVLLRGRRTHAGGRSITFDYRLGAGTLKATLDEHQIVWRSPGHLCPVRAAIAKATPFEARWSAEDLIWVDQLKPHLRTAIRAGAPDDVLYHYRWDPTKQLPWMAR